MLILTVITCVQFFACSPSNNGGGNNSGGNNSTNPFGTVADIGAHYVSGTLHKVNVTETQKPFVQNGKSEYVLVTNTTNDCYKAAGFISDHVYNATGCRLPTESADGQVYSADKKWIVVGSQELFMQAGLTMPSENLGNTGYYIISKDNSVFIATLDDFAIQRAAISFLSHLIGYEMYSENSVVYSKNGATMPSFNIIERPDIDYILPGSAMSNVEAYGMGYTTSDEIFYAVGGEHWHNSLNFFTTDEITRNPSWFSEDRTQLCHTARGDIEEYNKMQAVILDGMVEVINSDPTKNVITLTVEDGLGQDICGCEYCKAEELKYGTESAAIIKFVNDLSEKLDARLLKEAESGGTPYRDVLIYFFGYFNSSAAPVKLVDGKYKPIDASVVCRDNVGVYLIPSGMRYNKNLYTDQVNEQAAEKIKGWSAVTKNIFYWLYDTNFNAYFYPFNSYDVVAENFRFCKENATETSLMHDQSQYNQDNVTAFGRLKTYTQAKHSFNVNLNYNDTVNNFFEGYFKDAAVPMRQFFDELQVYLAYLEEAYPTDYTGDIYDQVSKSHLWSQRTLEHWLDLIDEAYASIEKYAASNPELYKALYENIMLESLFPRFALLELYPATYSEEQLYEARRAFVDDCRALNITNVQEHSTIDGTFKSWGF